MLSLRQVPLKVDIERINKMSIKKSNEQLYHKIIRVVPGDPNTIYEALIKNVKILKTNNVTLLNKAKLIENTFGLKVVSL